jgi:hypothetical protein
MSASRNVRAARLGLAFVGAATAVTAVGYHTPPALADTASGTTTANVLVNGAITLTDLTPAFTLTGVAGSTPTTAGNPVTMTVTTNNFAGYNVSVVPAALNLIGAIPGNSDVIPSNTLEVDGPAQGGAYAHLTYPTPLVVATKASPSAPGGDTIINNYRITIPFVRPDTYSGTLDYVATTL